MNDTYFDHQLTIEQLTKLLHAAKAGRRGDRDHLMILLGVSHGMRNSEICNLEVRDFDLYHGTVTIRRGKASLKTKQPMVTNENPLLDEVGAVTAYLARMENKRGKLFDIKPGMFRLLFNKYAEYVKIPEDLRTPHVLKHTAAHFALEASGNDLVAVQRFLGHKNLSSTGMYLKMGDEAACKKVQKDGYFPKG